MLHLITDIKFYTLLLIINTKLAFLNAFYIIKMEAATIANLYFVTTRT